MAKIDDERRRKADSLSSRSQSTLSVEDKLFLEEYRRDYAEEQAKKAHDYKIGQSAPQRAERMNLWQKVTGGILDPNEFEKMEGGKYANLYGKEQLGGYNTIMKNMKAYFQYSKDKQLSPGLASQTIFRSGLGQNMAKSTLLGKV